jgi:hypothetical protein
MDRHVSVTMVTTVLFSEPMNWDSIPCKERDIFLRSLQTVLRPIQHFHCQICLHGVAHNYAQAQFYFIFRLLHLFILWHDAWIPEYWRQKRRPMLGSGLLKHVSVTTANNKGINCCNWCSISGPREASLGWDSESRGRRSRLEAGSNTSTVALWVVRGDEKGSLESDTVKCGR